MNTIHFEVVHQGSTPGRLLKRPRHTWAGTVPGFGPVELTCPAEEDFARGTFVAWMSGQGIPPMSFSGIDFRDRPRLAWMTLTADGWTAHLKRRHLAVTAHRRALRIAVAGRSYRYRVLGGKLRHELRREGAAITMSRSTWRHPRSPRDRPGLLRSSTRSVTRPRWEWRRGFLRSGSRTDHRCRARRSVVVHAGTAWGRSCGESLCPGHRY